MFFLFKKGTLLYNQNLYTSVPTKYSYLHTTQFLISKSYVHLNIY